MTPTVGRVPRSDYPAGCAGVLYGLAFAAVVVAVVVLVLLVVI